MSDRSHSLLSGSVAHIFTECTGAPFLWQQVPPKPVTPEATEGTAIHDLGQILVQDFINHKLEGTDPEIRAAFLDYTKEQFEVARRYRDIVWKEILKESITEKAYEIEGRFAINEELQMAGFIDFVTFYRDERAKRVAAIIDLKTGYLPVPIKNNVQLAFYASAVLETIRREGKELDYIRTALWQPKTSGYQEIKLTAKQVTAWTKKFTKAATQILVSRKPRFRVGEYCTYCQGAPICIARADAHKKELALKLAVHDNLPLPELPTIPLEQIGEILKREDQIISFLKGVKSFAIKELQRGTKIPGVKLVEGVRRRTWIEDEEKVWRYLKSLQVEPFQEKLKGITEVERDLKNLGMSGSQAKELLGSVTELRSASVSIVDETDPRQAVIDMVKSLENAPV